MNIDIDVLCDVYSVLKEYIPQKDRQAAADNVMSVLVDSLSDADLKDFGGTDTYTKHSLEEYVEFDDDEEQDEDDYDYDD